MRIYHTTTTASAVAILREGFRDATGSYMFEGLTLTGVFFSEAPVGIDEGAKASPVLGAPVLVLDIPEEEIAEYGIVIDIPEEEIAEYGWVDAIREWCIPAALINRYGPPKVLYCPEDDRPDWWTDQSLLTGLRNVAAGRS